MDHECFFCRQPVVPNDGNVHNTTCCRQSVHEECHKRWCLRYYYCGNCRTSIPALEPMPSTFLNHFQLTEFLLSDKVISFLTVTIVGAGSEVDQDSLMSAIRKHLGNLYMICIERHGQACEGFQSGRIARVTVVTEDRQIFVVNNPIDTGLLRQEKGRTTARHTRLGRRNEAIKALDDEIA